MDMGKRHWPSRIERGNFPPAAAWEEENILGNGN
jgi:hypothetical protein